jgi:CrcB protein
MFDLRSILLVFIGSGIGGVARYGVNLTTARLFGLNFPFGTFTVNVVGGFVMGLIAGYLAFKAAFSWTGDARLFFATGIMGGFTTFSAFSLDAMLMIERHEYAMAALYIVASVALAIAALAAGLWLVRIAS